MRVLITGGGGFIGAWIARRLVQDGHEVRIFDLRAERRVVREVAGAVADEVDWREGNVNDAAAITAALAGCDAAVHLAALLTPACRADPVRGAMVNLIGSLNLFEAARRLGIAKLLYMSSAGVFSPHDATLPRPETHYGAFKLAMEHSALAYYADFGLSSIGFRPLVVYGPGREEGLSAGPSLACRAAARGESYVHPFTGATDLIYVEDVAAAFAAALATKVDGARVFNLLGEVATIDAVLAEIRRQMPGAALRAEGPPLPVAANMAEGDLAQVLPGLIRTPLAEGIARTIAHYRVPR